MYKISVPIFHKNIRRSNSEKLLNELKRFDTQRIFLGIDTYETDETSQKKMLRELEENCIFSKQRLRSRSMDMDFLD